MTTAPFFQRARTPDEKAHRQRAILEAAAALFDSEGLNGVSLNAVARRAGIAKSNLYRYFESREAMFLALLVEDETAWVASLEESLSRLPHQSDVQAVARALAQNIVAAPRLCALTAALSSVLERNVSDQSALAFKRSVLRVGLRIGNSLRGAAGVPRRGSGPTAAVSPRHRRGSLSRRASVACRRSRPRASGSRELSFGLSQRSRKPSGRHTRVSL
jgi:AcrR family transcriptional regulator